MSDISSGLFDTSGFPPRWYCGIWSEELGWLHNVSDIAIRAAHTTIPFVLGYLVLRLAELIEEAWQELEVTRQEVAAQLQVHNNLSDDVCEVDRFSMRQVFRNIFENSIQAARDSVLIDVHSEYCAPEKRNNVRIEVSDDGPRLTDEQETRLFESFFTTKKRGMGLGLAISQKIIAAHARSKAVGHGTTHGTALIIELPVRVAAEELVV